MPRYFMHLYNSEPLMDFEGREFADLDVACAAAREAAGELIAEQIGRREIVDLNYRLEITDDEGAVVAVLHYADFFQSKSG